MNELSDSGGTAEPVKAYLESVFISTAAGLIDVYRRSSEPAEAGLIFPKYRKDGSFRACEQEARILLVHRLLSDARYRVSVETPTGELYRFSGKGMRSGQVDTTIFAVGHEVTAHIEFKSDNRDRRGIQKDLEKLIRERRMGGWFHTLGAADRGTLPTLANKFKDAMVALRAHVSESQACDCLFAFCAIRNQVLVLRWHQLGSSDSLAAFDDLSLESTSWKVLSLKRAERRRANNVGPPRPVV